MNNAKLRAENARLRLLDRQTCGGCGEPICKDITLCRVCVDKVLSEKQKWKELIANLIQYGKSCKNCCNIPCLKYVGKNYIGYAECKDWQWQHADKLKEIGIETE